MAPPRTIVVAGAGSGGLTAALALIAPAILIVMGVVVLFILISLYLPICSLGSTGGAQG